MDWLSCEIWEEVGGVYINALCCDFKRPIFKNNTNKIKMLGSKDLGFYVFRTLMCIVGKP